MPRKAIIYGRVSESGPWVSSTDLMSGLMLLFMFIAVAYMLQASQERDIMHDLAREWAHNKSIIYNDLNREFRNDLGKWQAEIDSTTLSVRFREPKVLFAQGQNGITDHFKSTLVEFFPRYIKILRKHQESIAEIRIEGHTSSEWGNSMSTEESYIKNMILSHNRTQSVLVYCLKQIHDTTELNWARTKIVNIGISFSRPVVHNGYEDQSASRRVEFRVRTDTEERLNKILDAGK